MNDLAYSISWNNCYGFLRRLFGSGRNHGAPDAADLSWFDKNMRTKHQDKKQPIGKALIEIAIMKVDELRLVSHHVDGAKGTQ